MSAPLPLRDIHLPPEPSWWPPAPGWWLLAAIAIVAMVLGTRALLRYRRERRRRLALHAEFEAAVAIVDPVARLAAISQLLRRAARLQRPAAAALHGEAWLRFLDGIDDATGAAPSTESTHPFSAGVGRALLDGPYRAQTDAQVVEALIAPARARFRSLVAAP
jgi:Domain of unknown function (DUF4381)